MLEEQIEIVHRSWQPGPFDFSGRHYRIERLEALPKPLQHPHPNLILGGHGGPRSLAVAARWADEYNTAFSSLDTCRSIRGKALEAWKQADRDPDTLVFSLMTGALVGRDAADLHDRTRHVMATRGEAGSEDAAWLAENSPNWITGTVDQAAERLHDLQAAGVQRVMLQHQQNDDVDMVHVLGEIAAAVA
jgi:alkanesulfonate monooxygenase SsuD/methylene tetrahydromethanopterin reductase-like flavin-dependent oxidoreductase (luciferase family)